jgi:trypsin
MNRWRAVSVRGKTVRGLLALVLWASVAGSAEKKVMIQFGGAEEISLEMGDLRKRAEERPDLFGEPVPPGQRPSAVFVSTPADLGRCSANLIGPQVLLTAAHCVQDGAKVKVFGISGTCERARGSQSCPGGADVALCMMDKPLDQRAPFENLVSQPGWAKIDRSVDLLGFGLATEETALDLILRHGEAKVKRETDATTGCVGVTGQAAACSGDSGGGAFLDLGNGSRALAAVISSGLGCKAGLETGLVDVTADVVKQFMNDWRKRHPAARICGIDADAKNCRT